MRLSRGEKELGNASAPHGRRYGNNRNKAPTEKAVVEHDVADEMPTSEGSKTFAVLNRRGKETEPFRVCLGVWITLDQSWQVSRGGRSDGEGFNGIHER